MSDESTDAVVDVKHAIFLNEDGTEKERKPLDPDNKPHFDEDENLVIPHGSLKFAKPKKVFYKIWLDEDGNETKREERKRGRVPDRAYKDDDGNTVIPWEEPKAPAEAKVKTKIYLAKDGVTVIDEVQFTKGRLPERAYADPDDTTGTRFFIPWQSQGGDAPTEPETTDDAEQTDATDESPVVAEQDAPEVEQVDIEATETEAEPADELGVVN